MRVNAGRSGNMSAKAIEEHCIYSAVLIETRSFNRVFRLEAEEVPRSVPKRIENGRFREDLSGSEPDELPDCTRRVSAA